MSWLILFVGARAAGFECDAPSTVAEVQASLDAYSAAVENLDAAVVGEAGEALRRLACLGELAPPGLVADVFRAQAVSAFVASGGSVDATATRWLCGLAQVQGGSPWTAPFGPEHPLRAPPLCEIEGSTVEFPRSLGVVAVNGVSALGYVDRAPYVIQMREKGRVETHMVDGTRTPSFELPQRSGQRTGSMNAEDSGRAGRASKGSGELDAPRRENRPAPWSGIARVGVGAGAGTFRQSLWARTTVDAQLQSELVQQWQYLVPGPTGVADIELGAGRGRTSILEVVGHLGLQWAQTVAVYNHEVIGQGESEYYRTVMTRSWHAGASIGVGRSLRSLPLRPFVQTGMTFFQAAAWPSVVPFDAELLAPMARANQWFVHLRPGVEVSLPRSAVGVFLRAEANHRVSNTIQMIEVESGREVREQSNVCCALGLLGQVGVVGRWGLREQQ